MPQSIGTGLVLHYYERAKYQGYSYNATISTIAITSPGHPVAYARLESIILVEAQPKPLHVVMVRKLESRLVQPQGGQSLLAMVCSGGSSSEQAVATLAQALTSSVVPVCLAYHAIRPVKIAPLTLDKLVICDL
jgi:hypothetical protein